MAETVAQTKPSPSASPTAAAATSNANAWSKPLKPTVGAAAPPPPGMDAAGGKSPAPPTAPPGMAGTGTMMTEAADLQTTALLRDRFLRLTLHLVGQAVEVTLTDGSALSGVFHTFTPFASQPESKRNVYVIKAAVSVRTAPGADGPAFADGSTVVVPAHKVTCVHAKSVRLDAPPPGPGGPAKKGDAFRTDTDISGSKLGKDKDLVAAGSAWTSAGDSPPAKSAKSTSGNSRAAALMGGAKDGSKSSYGDKLKQGVDLNKEKIGNWDQFQANEELFNVKAEFDENLYTTKLDKSDINRSKQREAERLAREIEGTSTKNIHLAEERGHKLEGDYDEEDLYSGVLTSGGKVRIAMGKTKGGKEAGSAAASAAPKKMNYAAAAAVAKPTAAKKEDAPSDAAANKDAKADASKDDKGEDAVSKFAEEVEAKAKVSHGADGKAAKVGATGKGAKGDEKAKEKTEATDAKAEGADKAEEKPKSTKLSATAKSFSFNPGAKTFSPPVPAPAPMQPPPMQQMYMHPQGGMMPVMGQYMQYPQGAVPAPYGMPGVPMQQHMQMQPVPGPVPPQAPPAAVAAEQQAQKQEGAAEEGDPSQEGAEAEQQPQQAQGRVPQDHQQQPAQPQAVPGQYGVPPQAYYPQGMVPPQMRGPGGQPMAGYPPQMVGTDPYGRPVYQGGVPPQMAGPGGYYPGPPGPGRMPYHGGPGYQGHGGMDDGGRGGGGRGRGRGRGRNGRGRGRGRGGFNNHHNNSNHHHQQQQQPPQPQGQPQDGKS